MGWIHIYIELQRTGEEGVLANTKWNSRWIHSLAKGFPLSFDPQHRNKMVEHHDLNQVLFLSYPCWAVNNTNISFCNIAPLLHWIPFLSHTSFTLNIHFGCQLHNLKVMNGKGHYSHLTFPLQSLHQSGGLHFLTGTALCTLSCSESCGHNATNIGH
jgi:hypothetical protein